MTASRSRLAYRRRTRREVVDSAALSSENTGVIPLPALKATTSPSPGPRQNTPAGRVASTTWPGASVSFIQFDTTPPGTRFTVTCSSESTAGDEDIEWHRRCGWSSTHTRKVRNWPAS